MLETEGRDEDERVALLGPDYEFWDILDRSPDIWAQKYDNFEERAEKWDADEDYGLRFHTLLNYVQRPSYVVATDVPPWARDAGANAVKPVLDGFAGWSLCLDDRTFEGPWQDYLVGKRNGEIEFAAVQRANTSVQPKMEAAHAAFLAMGADKGDLSWEQIRRKLKAETGVEPTPRTLRRWRDRYRSGEAEE